MKKAVILLSGGLDSATCLAMAKHAGFACYALSFDYGQRHAYELLAAEQIARQFQVFDHRTVKIDVAQFGGSALTDMSYAVPDHAKGDEIPITYVPARNTTFLAVALGYAEVLGAYDIFIGANEVDYSGYPDCRPAFIEAFEHLANVATVAGLKNQAFRIQAPLLHLTKAEIIKQGTALGVDYGLSVSCYRLNRQGEACGRCDSCVFRKEGFVKAGIKDPTRYQKNNNS